MAELMNDSGYPLLVNLLLSLSISIVNVSWLEEFLRVLKASPLTTLVKTVGVWHDL